MGHSLQIGAQTFVLMAIGFGLACLAVFGITRALDKHQAIGWLWFTLGSIGCFFFYDWAWAGQSIWTQ